MAPRVGIEPTTKRLTVSCSTAELPRNKSFPDTFRFQSDTRMLPQYSKGLRDLQEVKAIHNPPIDRPPHIVERGIYLLPVSYETYNKK